jgi:hypothetical protein
MNATVAADVSDSPCALAELLRTSKQRCNLIMAITPADAEWALSHTNTRNRNVTSNWVDELTRRIKAGLWQLTHEGIAFDTNGVLIDGQHRLWAAALSETTVPMRVFLNEPPEGLQVIDTGRSRANHEVITLAGGLGRVAKNQLATLRVVVSGLQNYARKSAAEEAELLRRHRAAVDFAHDALPSSRYSGVATAVTRGVLGRAFYSADHDRLRHFADVLQSGVASDEADGPITLLLQAFLSTPTGRRSHSDNRVMYAKTQRALSAYLKGERISKLYAITSELFPLPGEE